MGIGHAAVALGASRVTPRVNVGILVSAAFVADFLLGIFGAMGWNKPTFLPNLNALDQVK